jgi:C4-dicarboxylate-specific signal transduction histidine kinase
MVEQILLNLLKNAIEALSPGDSVTIATGRAEREAFIEVQDDGPGLDAEAESTLFRPFATTKGPSGTGLGLAVSLRLARTLGGDLVRVPSPQGVRWRLSLPLPEPR